jgi:hypothetical protein
MQHKMWSITLDEKLHLAPINPNLQNVLDIATGTGIWAINFGTPRFLISYSANSFGLDADLSDPSS